LRAMPCALRAWHRWLPPGTLPWICLARVLNTVPFGRLAPTVDVRAAPESCVEREPALQCSASG
jgi:hypothetical protein